ncbi:MAG: hypothetical protein QNJ98_08125 [Planctomycetota bacterium]|nr:hypothetical protein [Planctomycetota bacterium]
MKPIALALCFALSLPLVACGGGGGGDDEDNNNQNNPVVVQLRSTADLDGNVAANNTGNIDVGGSAAIPIVGDAPFVVGDGALQRRGLWSFDLTGIPSNATITSATLRLVVSGTAGDPAAAMAQLFVDHVNYGDTFPIFNLANALDLNFAQITDLTTIGERLVTVTAQLQDDIDNNRERSQYRVRGAIGTNNDPQADFIIFTDRENTAIVANRPTLNITYTTP